MGGVSARVDCRRLPGSGAGLVGQLSRRLVGRVSAGDADLCPEYGWAHERRDPAEKFLRAVFRGDQYTAGAAAQCDLSGNAECCHDDLIRKEKDEHSARPMRRSFTVTSFFIYSMPEVEFGK